MLRQRLPDGFGCFHIPQNNRAFLATRGQDLAIWTKSDACYGISMPRQRLSNGVFCLYVPKDNGPVPASGCQSLTIRAKSDAEYSVQMPTQIRSESGMRLDIFQHYFIGL